MEEKHKRMMAEIVKEFRNLSGDSDAYLEVVQETADDNNAIPRKLEADEPRDMEERSCTDYQTCEMSILWGHHHQSFLTLPGWGKKT